MPALKLFGRKWLAASDDIVFPCIFEVLWRIIYIVFTLVTFQRYWIFLESHVTTDIDRDIEDNSSIIGSHDLHYCQQMDVSFIKTYLIGINVMVALNIPLLFVMISSSSRGAICDIQARRHVTPLLYLKLFLILPEIGMNVMGTIWAFTNIVHCTNSKDIFANTVIEVTTIFYWIVLSLIIFAIIIAYDPLGARKYRQAKDQNGNTNAHQNFMQIKLSKLWLRRFRLFFCCVTKDEYGDEAFLQCAEIFSNLFTGTDLVPSDMIAGSILMRVRQKKENRELRRIQMLNDLSCPRYSTDLSRVFNSQCPPWMNLRNAQHYLRFAVSSYGWPMLCAISPFRSCCGLARKVTCCAGLRNKSSHIVDDNCCNCNEAGTRIVAKVNNDDIIYASFKNQVFEVPFCILADHKMKSVVLTIRGSWSLSDIVTDMAAKPEEFNAPGFPENTYTHYGMAKSCNQLLKNLEDDSLLEKILQLYPNYELVLTGHSLGASLAILLGAKLRGKYRDLKVYAFAAPSATLTREAAKCTEQFALNLVIGDDLFARASVDAVESLRTTILESLQSCRLPKYRVILNGFAYALLGIPTRDLEKTWYNVNEVSTQSNHSSTLLDPQIIATITNEAAFLHGNSADKIPRPKLFLSGKVLHIMRKKKTDMEKKAPTLYEMRWAQPEDFTEIKVMPRMMFDHFPHNMMEVLAKILNERKNASTLSVDRI